MKKTVTFVFLSIFTAIFINLIQFFPVVAQSQNNNFNQTISQNSLDSTLKIGNKISLNDRTYPVSWIQWQDRGEIHTGISDIGALNILGFDLLSTNEVKTQPVNWYSFQGNLPTKFINPYRYLDITNFIPLANINVEIDKDILKISNPISEIENINIKEEKWGKTVEISLTKPTFFQSGQVNNQGILKIEALTNPDLLSKFAAPKEKQTEQNLTDDIEINTEKPELPLLTLEKKEENQTIVNLNLPDTKKLKFVTLANKLILEIKNDNLKPKNILWYPGLYWREKYINLTNKFTNKNSSFPVTYLEIYQDTNNLKLQPIIDQSLELKGINPLLTTARNNQVIAAINAGFFNRNNKLPLGAIKSNNNWLSGPILNRGAIAWNDNNQYKFGNLTLEETITTKTGEKLSIVFLNTAYLKAGITRYTPQWGKSYTTLSDQENIVVVENNIITNQLTDLLAEKTTVNIPENGYLLVLRSFKSALSKLKIGDSLEIKSITNPSEFNNYPNIMAAGPLLIENGKIVLNGEAEGFSKNFLQGTASRSAIAELTNGNIILVAVHNRIGGKGPSLKEMAEIMLKLGAKNALNLDGGSSTSLYLGGQLIDRSPLSAARVHNGIGLFINN